MASPETESLSIIGKGLAPLRQEMRAEDSNGLRKASQIIRAEWLRQPGQEEMNPKNLGYEMEMLDSLTAPILFATIKILDNDPQLEKTFNYYEPVVLRLKLHQVIGECLYKIREGEKVGINDLRLILEQTVSQEVPPIAVKRYLKCLGAGGDSPYLPLEDFFYRIRPQD